jgi:hypothetical protein
MSLAQVFKDKVSSGSDGEIFVYHKGFLTVDAENKKLGPEERHELADLQKVSYEAFCAGRVHLTQKKLGPGLYEYRAVISPHTRVEVPVAA